MTNTPANNARFSRLAKEFPGFDLSTLPAIPANWADISWRNDTCPSFQFDHETLGELHVWVDYLDPADRAEELGENTKRYTVEQWHNATANVVFSSDEFGEVLRFLEGHVASLRYEDLRYNFPRYDWRTLPALPANWQDDTNQHDACPAFEFEHKTAGVLRVMIDHAKASLRQHPEAKRFRITQFDLKGGETLALLQTDDFGEVLQFVETPHVDEVAAYHIAKAFADDIKASLTAEEFAELRRTNAKPTFPADCCASHNFLDSNMSMAAAYESVMGREYPLVIDGATDWELTVAADLWNRAWDIAKPRYLTGY